MGNWTDWKSLVSLKIALYGINCRFGNSDLFHCLFMFMFMSHFIFIEKQRAEMVLFTNGLILAFSYRLKWGKKLSIQLMSVIAHIIIAFSIVRCVSDNRYSNSENCMEKSRSIWWVYLLSHYMELLQQVILQLFISFNEKSKWN